MAQWIVKLVRYDTEKTKKRKRMDVIVDAKTEYSVVEKLERIHKKDSVVAIHEIVWGSEFQSKKPILPVATGVVKFFDEKKGYGFIAPDEEGEDLFFHASSLGDVKVFENDQVEFEVSKSPKGKGPVAVRILVLESSNTNSDY